jgi:ubiquinone/menaquinone biosynthesis C-methylase UbiE
MRQPNVEKEFRVDARSVELRYQRTDVAESYDGARFGGLSGRYSDWRLRRMVRAITRALPPSALVLDVPCGTGRLHDCLSRSSLRVIAADVSGEMLTVAQRKARAMSARPALLRADAMRLPLPPASIDVVFCIRFLHLLDGDARSAALTELARVARDYVVVEYRSVTKPLRVARRAVLRWLGARNLRTPTTVDDLKGELARCGLRAERCYFTSRWFSASVLIVARPTPRDDADPTSRADSSWLADRRALATGVRP